MPAAPTIDVVAGQAGTTFITMNWRGKPLISLETIVNLIGATTTSTGLEVHARLDDRTYPDKIRVSDAELKAVNLHGDRFHREWNYTIKPMNNPLLRLIGSAFAAGHLAVDVRLVAIPPSIFAIRSGLDAINPCP